MMAYPYVSHWSNCDNCSGPIVEFHVLKILHCHHKQTTSTLKFLLSPHALGSYTLDGHTFSRVSMTKGAVLITDHGLIIMSGTLKTYFR